MIQLVQFAPAFGLPNASPFCMKLETWLRMAGLPHRTVNDSMRVMKAPKGKLPYVVDDDGTQVADSTLAIEHLARRHGVQLDVALTAADRGVATAFQRLFEENLYWAMIHTRWADAAGWALTRQAFFGEMPLPLRWFVPTLARRGVLAQMRGQGLGRHRVEEIHAIACRDLTAVADFLADKPFLMGEAPTTVDAVAYAFLANILWVPLDTSLRRHAQGRPTLEAYCARMKARYYAA